MLCPRLLGLVPSPQVIATDLVDHLVSAVRGFPRILALPTFRPILAPGPTDRPPNGLEMAGLLMGFRPLQKARYAGEGREWLVPVVSRVEPPGAST